MRMEPPMITYIRYPRGETCKENALLGISVSSCRYRSWRPWFRWRGCCIGCEDHFFHLPRIARGFVGTAHSPVANQTALFNERSGVGLVVVVKLSALPPASFAERFPFGLGITLLTVYTGTRRG